MGTLREAMAEYRNQLGKGVIQQAYQGLMEYMMDLRAYFERQYPDYFVSGSLYAGYMDMTYFSFFPEALKQRKLKVAVVFLHEAFRFEVWLAAYNKAVQARYWKLIQESGWGKYRLVAPAKGEDAILAQVLADEPDFGDLEALSRQIEAGTLAFIGAVEAFLEQQGS